MKLHKRKIAIQIISIMMLSFIVISVLLYINVKEKTNKVDKIIQVQKTLGLMEYVSALSHELQKERGRSVGFVESGGKKFKSELQEQRLLTDEKYLEYSNYIKKELPSLTDEKLQEKINQVNIDLSAVFDVARKMTDTLSSPSKLYKIQGVYTSSINKFIRMVELLRPHIKNDMFYKTIRLYQYVLEEKELMGGLRANLSRVFAANKVTLGSYLEAKWLISRMKLFREKFKFIATKKHLEFYNKTMNCVEFHEVERLIKYVRASISHDSLGIMPEYWFAQSTVLIDKLKIIDDSLVSEIRKSSALMLTQEEAERTELLVTVIVVLLFILLIIFLTVRKIDTKLDELSQLVLMAERVSKGDYRFEISGGSDDEIKAVTQSFVQMSKVIESKVDELEKSEQKFRLIANDMPVALLATRKSDGTVLYANDFLCNHFGYKKEEIIGKMTPNFYHSPEGRARVIQAFMKKGFLLNHEVLAVNGDGSPSWISISMLSATFDEEEVFFVSFIEINDLKKAQKMLIESENETRNYKDALDSSAIIVITDRQGIIIEMNDHFCGISGYSREELIGKNNNIVSSSHHSEKFWQDFWSTISGGNIWRGEIRNRDRSGDLYWVDTTIYPVKSSSGEIEKYLAIRFDISSRKKTEGEIALLQTIMESIGHSKDFNSALEAVLGKICDATSWLIGEAWVPNHEQTLLECHTTYSSNDEDLRDFRRSSQNLRFAKNEGLPGRVWHSRTPQWDENIAKLSYEQFPRVDLARQCGIKAGFGVPIINDGELIAVLEFFTDELKSEDKQMIGFISTIANQLSIVVSRKQAEDKLNESEKNFRELFETMAQGIIFQDKTGHYLSANPAAEEILGLTVDELNDTSARNLRRKPLRMNGTSFERGEYPSHIALAEAMPILDIVMGVYNPRQNKVKWVLSTSIPRFREGEEAPYEVFTTFIDISDLKEAQESLQESQEKFQSLFDKSDDAKLLIRDNIFSDCNQSAVNLFGYEGKQEFMETHPSVLSPEKQMDGRASFEKAEEMMKIALENGSNHFEWIHRRANGEDFYAEIWLNTITTKNDLFILTVIRDLTELKNAQEALVKSEQEARNYKNALDSSANIVMTDASNNIIYVNDHFCETSGYQREEVVGQNPRINSSGYHSKEFWKDMLKTIHSGKVWRGEIRNKKKNGKFDWHDTTVYPIKSASGEITEFLAIRFDITERKNFEQEIIKANNQKDKLFSIIAHDLKGPFTGFLSLTEMLANDSNLLPADKITSLGKMMHDSAKSTYALLEDLLEWARSQSENLEFKQIKTWLFECVENIVNLYSENARAKNINLVANISKDLFVFADIYMLNTIFRNLVSNALKFTPVDGKIEISCEMVNEEMLRISISDSGVGIKEEILEKLFTIGTKHTSRGTEGEKGTGLGLHLCVDFAQRHGGELSAESTVGKGSIFSFTMPICKE